MAVNYGTVIPLDGAVAYFDSRKGISDALGTADPLVAKNSAVVNTSTEQTFYDVGSSNRYYHTDSTPDTLEGNSNLTVCGVFYRTGAFNSKGCWGIGGDVVNQGICSWNNTATSEITIDLWGRATFTSGQTYPANEWCFAAWTKTGGVFSRAKCAIWKNNVKYTGADLTISRGSEANSVSINDNGLTLGSINDATTYLCPIRIGFIIFYDRVLTDTEILKMHTFAQGRGYI